MSYVAVGSAPINQIEAVRLKTGWKFKWSSAKSDFNYDFHFSFQPEELANRRGGEQFLGIYGFSISSRRREENDPSHS
jgi:predicted dithiol-disulfide oxidoreductase (DUF899 family)